MCVQFFCSIWALSFLWYALLLVNPVTCFLSLLVKCLNRCQFKNSPPLSESKPSKGKGKLLSTSFIWLSTPSSPLPQTALCSVHPVAISTKFTVLAYTPSTVSPQWATVSASRNPGLDSSHWLVFIGICLRNKVPGLVVDLPRPLYFILTGFNILSIEAGDIFNNAVTTCNGNLPYSLA